MTVERLNRRLTRRSPDEGRVPAAVPPRERSASRPGRVARGQGAIELGVGAALVVLLALLGDRAAAAAGWGGITPGESTADAVRVRYGPPSSETKPRVDGYETKEWTYEGDRVPAGMKRMVVDFGLLTPKGFQPEIVRTFRLEPNPGVFSRLDVLLGWGKPDKAGETEDHVRFISYDAGLIVYFDKKVPNAVSMVFTRPLPGGGSHGAAAAPGTPPAPAAKSQEPPAKPPKR